MDATPAIWVRPTFLWIDVYKRQGLLGASVVAMVVAMLLQSEPIYDSLKRRMLSQPTVTPEKIDVGVKRPG